MTVHPLHDATVSVFGGAAGWGRRVSEVLERHARSVCIIEKDTTTDDALAAVDASSIVFLALPDNHIDATLNTMRQHLAGKIVIDCASNKSGFARTLEQIAASGTSVCSTHPMVVSSTSPRGHNVLVMPVGATAAAATAAAEAIYAALGMTIERFDFERHADAMIIVQMVPHLIQRILIRALGHGISQASMTIEDIARIAPANYLLAELGLGRVATQRPDVSAGIVATALGERFGRQILGDIQGMIGRILRAGSDRDELTRLFEESIATLDPGGAWRNEMKIRTEAALIRLGNLRSRHFVVEAPNQRGILRDILSILIDGHNIDMTALDSQVVLDDTGEALARFEIGITDEHVDFARLSTDLGAIGVRLIGATS
ncbi:MAG TPA: prephenate dehydrogenase/arogenate dehydrogenase family protein [Rudaea sp.]|jgi:prephenate dehydrogenase